MQQEPTSLRLRDAGIRALFSEDQRLQSWLDVEVVLAQAEAEFGIIPAEAAEEITRKARLEYLDREAINEGLVHTGHDLVPLIWELDRVCEGDAGGYVHWGATTQNITQTGKLLQLRKAHRIYLAQLAQVLMLLADLAERTKGRRPPRQDTRSARGPGDVRPEGRRLDRRAYQAPRSVEGLRGPCVRRDAGRRSRDARLAR